MISWWVGLAFSESDALPGRLSCTRWICLLRLLLCTDSAGGLVVTNVWVVELLWLSSVAVGRIAAFKLCNHLKLRAFQNY
jgi:hypothetical protein